jgi:hypothetical protein
MAAEGVQATTTVAGYRILFLVVTLPAQMVELLAGLHATLVGPRTNLPRFRNLSVQGDAKTTTEWYCIGEVVDSTVVQPQGSRGSGVEALGHGGDAQAYRLGHQYGAAVSTSTAEFAPLA